MTSRRHIDITTTSTIDDASTGIASATPDFAVTYAPSGNVVMPICRSLPRRLMGVWAHPDDEAYLSAGLMARVRDHGGEVMVVTATLGEQGTGDADLAGTPAFASARQRELESSLATLGVHDVRVLGLPDGGCQTVDPSIPVDAIVAAMGEFRPDTIVTFGPDGITFHPDHVAVSRWVTEAVARAVEPAELLYATMTNDHVRRYHDLHADLGLFDDFGPGRAASSSLASIALECSLTPRELDRKRAALACHGSQTDGLAAMLGEDLYREWVSDETFRRPTGAELAEFGGQLIGGVR